MKKYGAVITLVLLGGILLTLSVLDFCKQDGLYSAYENRLLAQKPKFGLTELLSGNYSKAYEEYITDQFVFRDSWIFLKTGMDVLLGKKDINGVYLAKDGTLIEQHLPEEIDEETVEKRLKLLQELAIWQESRQESADGGTDGQETAVEGVDRPAGEFYVMLVPTADNIRTEQLPNYADYYVQEPFLAEVSAVVGKDSVIDVREMLMLHKEEPIYYGTDHHWTTQGAYYGYLVWAEAAGVVPVSYDVETVSGSFLGSLHSMTHLPIAPDTIEAYLPGGAENEEAVFQVYYDFAEDPKDSIYEPEYLETKNQYGYFLDDNHPFIQIERMNPPQAAIPPQTAEGKSLFILKDSYVNCMVPFLTEHYETIYVLDLRYYHGKLLPLLEEYGAKGEMDLLICYNVIHFIEEFQFF